MDFETYKAKIIAEHDRKRPIYEARPIRAERFSVPRDGKPPVEVLLNKPVGKGPFPVLVNMHGGGFMGLDAVVLDDFCQYFCDELGMFVINVNYKLSPEVMYPYAAEEIVDVTEYFRAHAAEYDLDTNKFAVAGESAGSSLAQTASLMLRDKGRPYACQVLVYTVADLVPPEDEKDFGDFRRMYCTPEDCRSLYLSPLRGSDEDIAGQCPTVFVTCEFDTLRAGGEAYAKRLMDVGVPVAYRQFKGALHGFVEVCCGDSFFEEDDRKTPEQYRLAKEANEFIRGQLKAFLDL